jgi:hypothetical protein
MGMITRVRGRVRSDSLSKLDPRIKDEKIAKTGTFTVIFAFRIL